MNISFKDIKQLIKNNDIVQTLEKVEGLDNKIKDSLLLYSIKINSDIKVVKGLIDKGSSLNTKYLVRCIRRNKNVEVVKYFIEEKNVGNPIQVLRTAIRMGNINVVEYLLDKCENLDKDELMFIAIKNNQKDVVIELAKRYRYERYDNFSGVYELLKLIIELTDNVDMFKLFIEHASENFRKELKEILYYQRTKLLSFILSSETNIDLVKICLDPNISERLCDPFAWSREPVKNTFGVGVDMHQMIYSANLYKKNRLMKFFRKEYNNNQPFNFEEDLVIEAVRKGKLHAVKYLIEEKRIIINTDATLYQTLLWDRLDIAKYLVEKLNIYIPPSTGELKNHYNNSETCKYLIKYYVNNRMYDCDRVCYSLLCDHRFSLVQDIIESGADIYQNGFYGKTIDLAMRSSYKDILRSIVKSCKDQRITEHLKKSFSIS